MTRKRIPGHRDWGDDPPTYSVKPPEEDFIVGEPVVTLHFRVQLNRAQLEHLDNYLEFLHLVYQVEPRHRVRSNGWIHITLEHTPMRSMIGVKVASWLYDLPLWEHDVPPTKK